MKWTLSQLRKSEFPFPVDYTIDMKDDILSREDVYDTSIITIKGMCYSMENDEYVFSLDISADLKMACSVTLESVDYKLKFHTDEVFATVEDENDSEINVVTNNTIDLDEIIHELVLVNLPMKVVKQGAENLYMSEKEYNDSLEKEEKINPAFAELNDYFKK